MIEPHAARHATHALSQQPLKLTQWHLFSDGHFSHTIIAWGLVISPCAPFTALACTPNFIKQKMLWMCANQHPSSNHKFWGKVLVWKCSPWERMQTPSRLLLRQLQIDAAGRQVIDAVLMDELKRMKAAGEFQKIRKKLSFINGADFLSFFYSQSLGDSSCCQCDHWSWPCCDVIVAFCSKGCPLKKAKEHAKLKKPFILNDLDVQEQLKDCRCVCDLLVASGIDVPRHACLSRDDCVSTGSGDGNGAKDQEVTEHDDHNVEVNSISIQKPFVEKSIDADHNNVSICCPSSAGGGCEKLFRNAGNRSSEFYPNVNEVWRDGSRVYEEFLETQGACVKIHAAGPERGHAKARKSTTVDGKVQRNPNGKEIRFPVILTLREKEIVRRVVLGFKQLVRGFDLPCVQEGQFMSDFQKMRTMMSRMSKMMGPGGAPGGMDPAVEGADMDVSQMPGANRALRRSSKEKKKSGKGGGGGFG
jgi:hypothetical protein